MKRKTAEDPLGIPEFVSAAVSLTQGTLISAYTNVFGLCAGIKLPGAQRALLSRMEQAMHSSHLSQLLCLCSSVSFQAHLAVMGWPDTLMLPQ